jgi:DNA invertase Pin-like site-specific DNA recombinase
LDGTHSTQGRDGKVRQAQRSRQSLFDRLAEATARRVYTGRKTSIDPAKIKQMRADGLGASAIAKVLKIGLASVYRALAD